MDLLDYHQNLLQSTKNLTKSVERSLRAKVEATREAEKESQRQDLLKKSFQQLGQMQSQRSRTQFETSAFSEEARRRKRPHLNLPPDRTFARTGFRDSGSETEASQNLRRGGMIAEQPTVDAIERANKRNLAFGMIMAAQRYGDQEAVQSLIHDAARSLRDPQLKHLSGLSTSSRLANYLTPRFSPWGSLTSPVGTLRSRRGGKF